MTTHASSDSFKETYYIKDDGGEFIPVSHYDTELMSSFPYGSHLIRIHPGWQTKRFHVDPDFAAVIAALEYARDAITKSISTASYAQPTRSPATAMQKEAWDNMKEAFADDFCSVQYPSCHEIASSVIEELQFYLEEMMANDSVQKSYEEFVLVAKLCSQKNQNKEST